MKRKKLSRKIKKTMFGDQYDPNSDSSYAKKIKLQKRGIFSITSPCRFDAKSTYDPFINKPF
jgi:hypothetical protein